MIIAYRMFMYFNLSLFTWLHQLQLIERVSLPKLMLICIILLAQRLSTALMQVKISCCMSLVSIETTATYLCQRILNTLSIQ